MTSKKIDITHTFCLIFTISAVTLVSYMLVFFLPYSIIATLFTGIMALFLMLKPKRKQKFFNTFIIPFNKSVLFLFLTAFSLLAWPYMQRIPISIAYVVFTISNIYLLSFTTYSLFDITSMRIDKTKLILDSLLAATIISYTFFDSLMALNVFANLNIIKIFIIINLIVVGAAFSIVLILLLTVRTIEYKLPVLLFLIGDLLIAGSHFLVSLYLLSGNLIFNHAATITLLIGCIFFIQFYSRGFKHIDFEKNSTIRKASSKLLIGVNIAFNLKFFILIILPIILYVNHNIDTTAFIHILIGFLFYLNAIIYFHGHSLQKNDISKNINVTASLQKIVDAKTEELRRANKKLESLSTTDQLTKLPNRIAFYAYLNQLLASNLNGFTLLYLDLNRFKLINDIYGHEKGDYVLISIAERLDALCKANIHAFRVGGDEFTIVTSITDNHKLDTLSAKIIKVIEKPIFSNGLIFYLGTSIGIAKYGEESIDSIDKLVKSADIAMYQTKYTEDNQHVAYFKHQYADTLEIQTDISHRLETIDFDTHFKLNYQPIFDPHTQKIVKIEALLRWQDGDNIISPDIFIPLAEKNGVIEHITKWVLKTAIDDYIKLSTQYSIDFQITVNVSPKNIAENNFIDYLTSLKQNYSIDLSHIEIEITENFSIMTLEHIKSALDQIKSLGYSISIDDFGTGYSSLKYLKEFSVDTLKIAKELIDHIDTSESDQKMVASLIELSKALSLTTVIEGVETKAQLDKLLPLGCHYIQGYYYAKPIPLDVLIDTYILKGAN